MDQFKKLLGSLSVKQRWTLVIAAILVGGGLYELSNYQREANFKPLYNSLSPEDAGVVVQ